MSLPDKKKEAVKLRQNGLSIKKISLVLGISQSTASRWCKNVLLSDSQMILLVKNQRLAGIRALKKYNAIRHKIQVEKKQRDEAIGRSSIGQWNKRDLYITGLALYWGEGYKKGNAEFGFTNSDPKIILIIVRWLTQVYKIEKRNLILRVSINKVHENRVDDILEY
ncbi:MAG: helix-turn-helix domain-containing protein [Patescibacteria group bacterium]